MATLSDRQLEKVMVAVRTAAEVSPETRHATREACVRLSNVERDELMRYARDLERKLELGQGTLVGAIQDGIPLSDSSRARVVAYVDDGIDALHFADRLYG